jgi:Reverse transcriptase (RNA-dependent DNA polymerase)
MTSRTVLSDSTPARNSRNLDSRSIRSHPAFVSPSFEDIRSQQANINTPPPHSLRRPSEVMPNQPLVETVSSEMDEASETNSIRSTMSHSIQDDLVIPAPPLNDYAAFIEWLMINFAPYFSEEFEQFLLQDMKLLTLQELSDFVDHCAPKTLHQSIGSMKYDAYRTAIIDLKIIWQYMQQSYLNDEVFGSYTDFMNLREKLIVRTTVLFPSSETYTTPTPVYRPVSDVVGKQAKQIWNHGSRFYSANVTPDTTLQTQTESMPSKIPDSASPPYTANSPRMVFPASDVSSSGHSGRDRKPSTSALFSDRYASRASQAYVPPHAKSPKSSEHTPVRSGNTAPREAKQPTFEPHEDATVLTNSQHSSQSDATKSVKSTSQRDGYSIRSTPDKSNRSNRSQTPSITADFIVSGSTRSTRSAKSSTRGLLHHKPFKPRAKLNEKVHWDGYGESFLSFRRAIQGHLYQVGAGYLLENHFLYYYKLDPIACQMEETYSATSDIWICYKQSCHQIRYDTEYFYGMLVSACRNISNKTIVKHENDRDGIMAWQELRRDFDNDGSKSLRIEELTDMVGCPYKPNQTGGLASYLDKFLTAFHELEIIGGEVYSDVHKKRSLMKNVRGVTGMSHLVQKCRDDFETMTFDSMAQYLRENSKNIESDPGSRKRIMNTIGEANSINSQLSLKETMELFDATARESSIFQAYQAFSSRPIRQSLNIPDEIWKAMEPAIQDKVKAIREQVKAKRQENQPNNSSGIPAQYPSMKHINMVDTNEEDIHAATVALCETLGNLTILDGYDTDDDACMHQAFMTAVVNLEDDLPDDTIIIRAHLEYTKISDRHYAISDSGADSSILGLHCHVVSHTGRHAYLVGYDPATTRSAKIPIVSGYVKVMSQIHIPIVLQINEAPYNATSPVTLLSEYQARDYGTIIDSVSRRHKTISGTLGTQRMMVSPDVYVPFVDRGGLMGFEILPWQEGDEDRYEVFEITSDAKWTPRRYLEDDPEPYGKPTRDVMVAIQENETFQDAVQDDLQDSLQDVSSEIPQAVPQDESSLVDDDSIPSIESCASDLDDMVEDVPCVVTYNVTDVQAMHAVVPCGMTPPVSISIPNPPYHYDPTDDDLVSYGFVVENLLSVPETTSNSTDHFLSYLTYRELTGYDEYDGFYDGYPAADTQLMVPEIEFSALFSTKDPPSFDTFDSRVFAVASWHRVLHQNLDPTQIQPYLGFAPIEVIKKTLERTTQMAKMILRAPLRRHIKSRLSFMQAKRLEETVSTDPMFSNCRSLGHGYTGAQVFYGLKSTQIDVYGFRSKGEFPHRYRDFIRDHGAPSALRRDNAKEEKSEEVDQIHRELFIKDQFCEPYNPQQNPVESRGIKYLKEHIHVLLDRTGAPDAAWFHAAQYLAGVHSILSNPKLPDQMTPKQYRTGVTPDISPWLQFTFWQPILFLDNENSWPSSKERSGYWLGVAENIGDFLTYWIFDDQSKQVLARSVVRPYNKNKRVKWDPILASHKIQQTAQHGGDIKPHKDIIQQNLSNLMDDYDEEEHDPEPHYFDAKSSPTDKVPPVKKGSFPQPVSIMNPYKCNGPYLDTGLPPFVPVEPKDPYSGDAQLRLLRYEQPIDSTIPYFPRRAKENYNDIRYSCDYAPPAQSNTVELPTKEKKTEPVQDPVPRVKGIGGTPPENRRSSRLAKAKIPAEASEETGITDVGPSKKTSKKFIGNLQTIWKPSRLIKGLTTAALMGVCLVPNCIIAEPANALLDLGTENLFSDTSTLKPINQTSKMEKLRAYHMRLDILNEIESPDLTKADWDVLFIDKYVTRKRNDDSTDIVFKVQWMGGDKSWVKMSDLRLHDPLLVLRYGLRHQITRKPGWEWVENFVNSDGELSQIIHAYKVSKEISYKFGVQVPNSTQDALRLDSATEEKLWHKAIEAELQQINDYKTFRVLEENEPIPLGYKRIPYHCVYDVKFDGRRKCRLVAGGHRTDPPKEDIFSGVVSMEAVRLGFILARLNGLMVCAGDVGNAFLYGKTREKVYVIAGEEFGVHKGKRMIIDRSLYGLRSSAARFHEHLSEKLRKMGFRPSKADPDLWFRKLGDHYEYIARFVDDVIAFSKDPMAIMKELEKNYIMKGVGKPQYYLGGDVVELQEPWSKEGIFTAFSAETYIKNCLPKLSVMCGLPKFKKQNVPFSEEYHPELDTSELLSPPEISKYKSLIGSGNWLITLGRFDIQFAISTLSQYSMAPRAGHMNALHRVFGYLARYAEGMIPIDVADAPIRKEAVVTKGQNWIEFYPDAEEDIPYDMLTPMGEEATMTVYVDADHARDQVTRRSVTGIMLLVNNTPLVWISKRQKTVESSTYGSELVAARVAIDLIIEMRYKFRMLGVVLEKETLLVGDNMSVVLNTTIPSSSLKKKHLACSYHRVREAIAGGFVNYGHIPSTSNLADIGTKPLSTLVFHRLIDPYLFRYPQHLKEAKGIMASE